jgi:hypothetical protein
MTPRISLITAVVAAALTVGAPAAFGDNWGADRQAGVSADTAAMLDARERAQAAKFQAQLGDGPSTDAFDRAVAARIVETVRPLVGDGGDRFTIDGSSNPGTVAASGSGREIEWPQIGLGVLLGIVLALGLTLVVRTARSRELAH